MEPDQVSHSCIVTDYNQPLHEFRHSLVLALVRQSQVKSVLDLGCGQGRLLQLLSRSPQLTLLSGLEIEKGCLLECQANTYPEPIQSAVQYHRKEDLKILIYQGNLLQSYPQLQEQQFQMITFIEVIEHLQPSQVEIASSNIFGFLRPQKVVITTPNRQFNVHFSAGGELRHWDHKFQWDRKEFQTFCQGISHKHGYGFQIRGIGKHITDQAKGCCSQMAVFTLAQHQPWPSLEKQEGNGETPLELRKEYIVPCWASNLSSIMLDTFYSCLNSSQEQTFEFVLQHLQDSLLAKSLPSPPTADFLLDKIAQFPDKFSWDEHSYKLVLQEESESEFSSMHMPMNASASPLQLAPQQGSQTPVLSGKASPVDSLFLNKDSSLEEEEFGFGFDCPSEE